MKSLILLMLVLPLFSVAQYTSQEIKKNKISKITMIYPAETDKQVYFYDRNGNDTAVYIGNKLIKRSVYSYNSKGQAIKRMSYDGEGTGQEVALYHYQSDGSYTIDNTDQQFSSTDHTYFDKEGNITKIITPDSAQRIYTYDAKKKLLSIKLQKANNTIVADSRYSYNNKGQLIKTEGAGDYKWYTNYTYNSRGLIDTTTFSSQDDKPVEVKYSYTFWK